MHEGTYFLVTEYLAGESLSERLRSGSIPLADAPGYTIDISDALDCAHAYIGVKRWRSNARTSSAIPS